MMNTYLVVQICQSGMKNVSVQCHLSNEDEVFNMTRAWDKEKF